MAFSEETLWQALVTMEEMRVAGKRGHNEGSIFWLESKERWAAEVSLPDGKRKRHLAKTKREALEWLNRARLQAQEGTLATGPHQTVAQFLDQWLKDTAPTNVRPSTLYRYCALMRNHAIPAIGKLPLAKVTPQHLQHLYSEKLAEGLAPSTVGQIHRILHRALKDAMRWGLIPRNPCDLVSSPKRQGHEIRPLTEEQVIAFIKAARTDPLEALYVLAVTTGMRQGELFGLKWEDLSDDGRTLSVKRSLQYLPGKGYVFQEPKSAKGRRKIVLTPIAIMALSRHRERQALLQAAAGDRWEDTGLVFTNLVGRALDASNVTHGSFPALLERAGLVVGALTPEQRQQVLGILQVMPQWAVLPVSSQVAAINSVAKSCMGRARPFDVMLSAARTLAAAPTGSRSIRVRYKAAVESAIANQPQQPSQAERKQPRRHIRFHDLRHSAATMLLLQGTHPKVVQEVLGHATISVTMDTYSHVLPGLQDEAMDRLNRRLAAAAALDDSEAIADQIADQAAGCT